MTHAHRFVVHDDYDHPNTGLRHIQRRCLCGLVERRRYDGKLCVKVEYRYDPMGGGFIDASRLLALELPVWVCETCHGCNDDCELCNGTGVIEGVSGLDQPPRRKRRR